MKGHEGYVQVEEVQEPVLTKKTASKKVVDTAAEE
jgi:hypothetical protein